MGKHLVPVIGAVLRPALAALAAASFVTVAAPAHARSEPAAQDALGILGARAVGPGGKAVRFQQVQFVFDAGRSADSDWGQVEADVDKLRRMIGDEGGYLNVALHSDSLRGRPAWVVENLRIPPQPELRAEGITEDRLRDERIAANGPQQPMTAYFDLRPDQEGSGRVDRLAATVLLSTSPLPAIERVWSLIERVPHAAFAVEQVLVNSGGDLGEATSPPPPSSGVLLLGPPPQPIMPAPELPSDFAYAQEVIQYDQPNINAALNQCMPMAHALVLGYLRIRYNTPPLSWPLPHYSSAGIGLTASAGDVVYWVPQPESSRVAQIDARTRRAGVLNFDSGGGAQRCEYLRATFSYLAAQGAAGQIVYRHQGGSPLYGAGAECDGDPTLPLGGIVSTRQGVNPTWEWIFQELQLGRGVFMAFGYYDVAGVRTGGHAVRIFGARRFNGRSYVYTLDDGNQGSNNVGLQTKQWEVADAGTPGMPGVPNGRLELGGTTSEIEFVMSAEAKPTLLVP